MHPVSCYCSRFQWRPHMKRHDTPTGNMHLMNLPHRMYIVPSVLDMWGTPVYKWLLQLCVSDRTYHIGHKVGLLGTPTVHTMTTHLCTFLNTRIHVQMTCPNRAVGSSRASRALALPLLGLGTKLITNYSQSKASSSLSSLGNGAKPSRVQRGTQSGVAGNT